MRKEKGFSLIELLIVVAIILIIAAIAIPNLLRSKMAANESSAVGSSRTINTAEVTYATAYPNTGYSANVASLGGVSANLCDHRDARRRLPHRQRSGECHRGRYVEERSVVRLRAERRCGRYQHGLYAAPANAGTTGQRFFFTDQSGVIRYGLTGAATAASSAIQ